MSDFASAAMLRVLHAGMSKLGLRSPVKQWLRQATVPLDAKQQLVGKVLRERGMSSLLFLGQGIHDLKHDSLMPMLIHPGQPLRILRAWLRLERYLHSKHRIAQTIINDEVVQHQHFSIKEGSEPSAAEDLVVLGVLIALLQNAGCNALGAHLMNGVKLWPWQDSPTRFAELQEAVEDNQTHDWCIRWHGVAEVLTINRPSNKMNDMSSISLSARVRSLASQSLGEPLSLASAAAHLMQSTRSLQRHLQLEGVTYIDLIASARAERASQMLSISNQPALAEIGFACGYTDQAHFCRDFKRRVGMSPARFREYVRR
jgi:AraC-like DNA-binding protein